jgi:tetratricopeptide (TPR) repeat protein
MNRMAPEAKSRSRILRPAVTSLTLACALCLAPSLQAQTPAPAPKDSPAQLFPYPGDPAPAAPPPSTNQPDAPKPSSQTGQPSADDPVKKFPYPGEKTLPKDPAASGRSSSSSSSSSTDPTSDPDMPGAATPSAPTDPSDPDYVPEKSVRRKLPKVKVLQSDEDREAEDVKIAKYYGSTGNWNAAYRRSKDAVKIKPDDPDARQLLGEAAIKLKKNDEAAEAYNALLKLDASDQQLKAAHKALEHLQ